MLTTKSLYFAAVCISNCLYIFTQIAGLPDLTVSVVNILTLRHYDNVACLGVRPVLILCHIDYIFEAFKTLAKPVLLSSCDSGKSRIESGSNRNILLRSNEAKVIVGTRKTNEYKSRVIRQKIKYSLNKIEKWVYNNKCGMMDKAVEPEQAASLLRRRRRRFCNIFM